MPASMIPTPMSERTSAIWSFSSGVKWTPGICSPSRSVSSQNVISGAKCRWEAVALW